MGKKSFGKEKHISDRKIDFSDIPESTNQELARARRVGRPKAASTKQLISLRVDPVLLAAVKKKAAKAKKPYQTFIQDVLKKAVR